MTRRPRHAPVPAPPGMPPALATWLPVRGRGALVAATAAPVCLVLAVLRGAQLDGWVFAIVGAGAGYLALQTYRAELAAGSGWLSARGVTRRRWVRTDQVVRVRDEPSGVDRVLVLWDRDGRKVGVTASELRGAPAVRGQLARDLATAEADGLQLAPATRERLGLS